MPKPFVADANPEKLTAIFVHSRIGCAKSHEAGGELSLLHFFFEFFA